MVFFSKCMPKTVMKMEGENTSLVNQNVQYYSRMRTSVSSQVSPDEEGVVNFVKKETESAHWINLLILLLITWKKLVFYIKKKFNWHWIQKKNKYIALQSSKWIFIYYLKVICKSIQQHIIKRNDIYI